MRTAILLTLVAVLALSVRRVEGGTCRALALAGGGDKGAYEAGVLRGLLNNLPPVETQYQVVTGISAGAVLSTAFAVYDIGQESDAVDLVFQILNDLNQSAIFKNWPGGVIEGFLEHSSLFDSTPIRDLLTGLIAGRTLSDRTVCMGATNVGSGGFDRFCNHLTPMDAVNAALASSAIPGVFIDQQINGNTYVDGGTLVNNDVSGAVEGCLFKGFAQKDIIVDAIECESNNITTIPGDLSKLTVLPIMLRNNDIQNFGSLERAYLAAVDAYPDVQFRYRIRPSEPIPGSGIDFNQTEMKWMMQLGEQDAYDTVHPSKFQTRIILDEQ
jgi:predicted patatin/cPLA2 family phospholipase